MVRACSGGSWPMTCSVRRGSTRGGSTLSGASACDSTPTRPSFTLCPGRRCTIPTATRIWPPLNEEAEWAALRAAPGSLDEVTVTRLSDPCTLAALEAELRRGYHVLHLVAHGTYHKERRRAALYLSDETNHVTTVWEGDLARMLKHQLADGEVQDPDRLRLVDSVAGIRRATKDGKLAIGIHFQGTAPVGDDLFRWDGLHMKPEGYVIWTSILKPVLEETFKRE